MKTLYTFLVLCLVQLVCLNNAFAQSKTPNAKLPSKLNETNTSIPEKNFSKLSLKAGANLSVVYLARNIKEESNEPGFSAGLTYAVNNFVRVSTLYSQFKPVTIEPTWLDVKAKTLEANIEVLANFPNRKTLLYPFAGLSYNSFKGLFTGQSDYLNLKEFYTANTIVTNRYLGLNLGTGVEHTFGYVGIYLDYRMRIGKQDGNINIMDVCYTGGIKINLPGNNKSKEKVSKEKYSENVNTANPDSKIEKVSKEKHSENAKTVDPETKKENEVKTPAKKSKAQKMWHRITHPNDKFHWF